MKIKLALTVALKEREQDCCSLRYRPVGRSRRRMRAIYTFIQQRRFLEQNRETRDFLKKVGTFMKNRPPLIRKVEGFSKNLAMKLIN